MRAARSIEGDFGTDKALAYLIGEKFLNFLEAAETDARVPEQKSPPSSPRSRRSSSGGNWPSIWKWPD